MLYYLHPRDTLQGLLFEDSPIRLTEKGYCGWFLKIPDTYSNDCFSSMVDYRRKSPYLIPDFSTNSRCHKLKKTLLIVGSSIEASAKYSLLKGRYHHSQNYCLKYLSAMECTCICGK